jgi:hypothetical protein
MSSPAIDGLRIANSNLRAGLARLLPEANPSTALTARDFSGLLVKLLRARDCLQSVAPCSAPEMEVKKAISEYRTTVEQLALALPRMHGKLLIEKARLEIAQAHVTAAAAWAQASQNIL